jgi:hypothetical protein
VLELIGAASIPCTFLCRRLFDRVVAKTDLLGIVIKVRKGEEGTELPMQPFPWFRGLAFPLVSKIDGCKGLC